MDVVGFGIFFGLKVFYFNEDVDYVNMVILDVFFGEEVVFYVNDKGDKK